MQKLMKILTELHSEIAPASRGLTESVLDSIDIVTLVTDLDDAYGIEISALDITRENFDSPSAIAALIERLGGEIK